MELNISTSTQNRGDPKNRKAEEPVFELDKNRSINVH
jgi:hypothetical protein